MPLNILFAQNFKINLSPRHVAKVEQLKTAQGKLTKYRKYFSKDSARHMKKMAKVYQTKSDSITKVMVAKEKLRQWREKKGIKEPIDTLALLEQYSSLLPTDITSHTNIENLKTKEAEKRATENLIGLHTTELQNQFGLTPLVAQQYLSGDAVVKKKVKEKAILLAKKPVMENILTEQKKQVQELQSKFGFSPNEVNQYLKGDTTARKKMKTQALHVAKEKSLASLPPGQRKQVEVYQKEYGPYSKEMKQYLFFLKDSVDHSDTLKSLAASRAEGWGEKAIANNLGNNAQLKQLNDINKQMQELKDSPAQYRKKLEQYKNKENLQKEVKDYLTRNPQQLKQLKDKMSVMMKKYSFIQNSNNLSTAVKRTSLKERAFRERLVVAANFQVLSTQPFSIDFAPFLGYKVNSRFSLGVGGTYRKTFSDSVPSLAPSVYGYKVFVSYDIIKSFFAYGEYANNSPGVKVEEGTTKRIWKPAAMVGLGKRLSIHSRLDMTVVALYNILYQPRDPIYHDPFTFRVGFQLSELALRKK